jgi:hypothetical protein
MYRCGAEMVPVVSGLFFGIAGVVAATSKNYFDFFEVSGRLLDPPFFYLFLYFLEI